MNSRCFLRFRGGPALLVLQPIIFALSLFGSALHPLSKSEVEVNRHSNAGKHAWQIPRGAEKMYAANFLIHQELGQ